MTQPSAIFLDLETTCLDPDDASAAVLELAMLAVDPRTLQPRMAFSSPVRLYGDSGQMRPDVFEMHTASGLLAECATAPDAHEVYEAAAAFFHAAGGRMDEVKWRSPLCGANGGDFDRRWLRYYAPALHELFHYRVFETNTFWLLDAWVAGTWAQPKQRSAAAHRALPDCYDSLDATREHVGLPPCERNTPLWSLTDVGVGARFAARLDDE